VTLAVSRHTPTSNLLSAVPDTAASLIHTTEVRRHDDIASVHVPMATEKPDLRIRKPARGD